METYPSKILIFGEYSILLDSYALAMPFDMFRGEWAFMEKPYAETSNAAQSNKELKKFLNYLKDKATTTTLSHFPDTVRFESDLDNGLYFKSNIPEGSGFGSSGALTAAVLKRYDMAGTGEIENAGIRKSLATLESYFHGISSGIDPLVSYAGLPLLINSKGKTFVADLSAFDIMIKYGLFIVRGEKLGNTELLVNKFCSRVRNDKKYSNLICDEYIPFNNRCVVDIIRHKDFRTLFSHLRTLVLLQISLFSDMIGEKMISHMEYGINHNLYALKLCGSGGGGYMLGFTDEPEKTKEYFENKQYNLLLC